MNKIIVLIVSIFCAVYFYEGNLAHFSERVYITSLLIMIISIVSIFKTDSRPYSLRKIFYLFTFFFFGIAPLIQFYRQTSSFSAPLLKEYEYFWMNVLLINIIVLYDVFYRWFSIRYISINPLFISRLRINKNSFKQEVALIILAFISLFYVLYSNDFVIGRLFFRGGEFSGNLPDKDAVSSSFDLLLSQTVRPLAFICLLYYLLSPGRKAIITLILTVLAIITVFPAGVPRFYAAAVYIPLLLICFKPFARKNIFSITFIAGLLVIFPFLNNFRHFSSNSNIELKLDFEMFTEGHFDSYQNFALIFFHNIITWGSQLLGVLFFWVPRSVWPTKPVGSGYLLAHELHFSWDNVSANYFAEGYINFGFGGIFLFILFLSFVTAILDNIYWERLIDSKNNFFRAAYLLLLGMLFFVMRGDLLSSTAFTVGFMFSIFIVFVIVHKKYYATNN